MGVHGLWKLLESTGRPVNFESLEGKVLAVDVSIWLNQAVLGVHGNSLSNPHLQVLFNRICKLLFYRIKPIFVFDGVPPQLKRQTLAARRQRKTLAAARSEKTAERIVKNYLKSHALRAVMGESGEEDSRPLPMLQIPRKNETDLYELPPMPSTSLEAESRPSSEDDDSPDVLGAWVAHQADGVSPYQDLTAVDIHSESFQALPVEVQHELISEMQETAKRSSWSRVHQLPKDSHDFSSYQMRKLLMKSQLSLRLDNLQKEMRMRMSLSMATLLDAKNERSEVDAGRVASEDAQHYILMRKDRPKEGEEEGGGEEEAVVLSYGEKAGFATSLDLKMEKAVRKRTAVATETRSSPSPSVERDSILISNDDSSAAENSDKSDTLLQGGSCHGKAVVDEKEKSKGLETGGERSQSKDEVVRKHLKEFFEQYQSKTYDQGPGSLPEGEKKDQATRTSGNQASAMTTGYESEECLSVQSDDGQSDTDDIILLNKSFPRGCSKPDHEDEDDLVGPHILDEQLEPKARNSAVNTEVSVVMDVGDDDNMIPCSTGKAKPSGVILGDAGAEVVKTDDQDGTEEVNNSPRGVHEPDTLLHDQEKGRTKQVIESVGSMHSEQKTNSRKVGFSLTNNAETKALNDNYDVPVVEISVSSEPDTKEDVTGQKEPDDNEEEEDGDEDDFVEVKDLPSLPPSWTSHTQRAVQAALSGQDKPEGDYDMENLQESDQEPDLDEWRGVDLENIQAVSEDLESERRVLEMERRKQQKKSSSITDTMYADSKELLQCFGLPYLDSPQEAEAQCAFLDVTNQTEGTITDDSDIWLFGGRRVYKSFFSKKRDPESFAADDIERQLLLCRSKLINLAYLMGSDYTLGVQGVGYVTAMELLNEFKGQGLDSLQAFKEWWSNVQEELKPSADSPVKRKLRKLTVPGDFPNPLVSQAYLSPVVDESEEPFQWGIPDLDLIREFARERFGWMKSKVDDHLLPVLRRLNERQVQSRMTSFFSIAQHGDRKISSKRIKKVLQQMGRTPSKEGEEEEEGRRNEGKKKRKTHAGEVKEKKTVKRKGRGSEVGGKKTTISKRKRPQDEHLQTPKKGVKRKKRPLSVPRLKDQAELSGASDSESESSGSTGDGDFSSEDQSPRDHRSDRRVRADRREHDSSNRARRSKRVVDYHEDTDEDYFSDQDLIEIAESLEVSARMKRARGGHSFTTDLRNVGSDAHKNKDSGSQSRQGSNGATRVKGPGHRVQKLSRGGGQSGRGKGAKAGGSKKGKALVKAKTAFASGPNLSTSGSDSD